MPKRMCNLKLVLFYRYIHFDTWVQPLFLSPIQLTLLAFKISLFDEAKRRNSVDLHLQVPPDLKQTDALQCRLHKETSIGLSSVVAFFLWYSMTDNPFVLGSTINLHVLLSIKKVILKPSQSLKFHNMLICLEALNNRLNETLSLRLEMHKK